MATSIKHILKEATKYLSIIFLLAILIGWNTQIFAQLDTTPPTNPTFTEGYSKLRVSTDGFRPNNPVALPTVQGGIRVVLSEPVTVPELGATPISEDIAVPTVVVNSFRHFNLKGEGGWYTPSIIIVNEGNVIDISFTSVDDNYSLFFPDFGLYKQVNMGQTGQIQFQGYPYGEYTFYCSSVCQGQISGKLIVVPSTSTEYVMPLTSGNRYNFQTPYFKWTGAADNSSGVAGYYVYFGTSPNADPVVSGTFQTDSSYVVSSSLTSGFTYYLLIKTRDNSGNVSTSTYRGVFVYRYDTNPPSILPPRRLGVTAGVNQAQLIWRKNRESNILRYRIYAETVPHAITAVDSTNSIVDTSKTVTNLTAAVGYYFRVTAIDSNFRESNYSNEVSAMPRDATIPNPPTSLSATASSTIDKRIDLLWTASSSLDVKNYLVYRDTVSFTDTTGKRIAILATNTNYADVTSTYGTFYYRLVARDSSGNVSSLSNETSAVSPDKIVPNPPTSLVALPSPVIDKRIDLAWTASISSDVANHLIYRSTATITDTTGKKIAIIGNITSYADITPSYGRFYYKVFARDGSGNVSTSSNEVNALSPDKIIPTAPQGLTATAGDRQVTLKWSKNAEADFFRYLIYGGTVLNPTTPIDFTTGINDTSKIITGLLPGTTYYFRITAIDSNYNESGYSNQVNATPIDLPPAAPQNLTATAGNGQVSLKWNRVADTDLKRYRIYRGTSSPASTLTDSTSAGNLNDTTKTIAGLTNGTTYYFRITTLNSADNESQFSNEVSVTPKIPATSLFATAINTDRVTLSWNTLSGVVSYKLYRGADSTNLTLIKFDTMSTFIDSTLTPSSKYFYRIAGVGSNSIIGDLSFAISVVANPATPNGLSFSTVADIHATLIWSSGGGTPALYKIYRSDNGTTYSAVGTSVTSSYKDSTLTQLSTYYYKVSALNSVSVESPQSQSLQITTKRQLPRVTSVVLSKGNVTYKAVVPIIFTVTIAPGDTTGMFCYFSVDSGKTYQQAANISGKINTLTSSLTDTIFWNTSVSLADKEEAGVNIRIVPVGLGGRGDSLFTLLFKVDNKAPQFAGATSAIGDTNRITINWIAATDLSTPISYKVFKRTEGSLYNFNSPDTSISGTTLTIKNLENFKKYYCVVRAVDNVGNIDTNTVEVNATPKAVPSIVTVVTPSGTQRGKVKVPFTLSTVSQDSVSLVPEYSVDGGITWRTTDKVSGKISNITSQLLNDTLVWNSGEEFIISAPSTNPEVIPTNAKSSRFVLQSAKAAINDLIESGTVQFRIKPFGRGGEGNNKKTNNFTVDNRAPIFVGATSATGDTNRVTINWSAAIDLSTPIIYKVFKRTEGSAFNFNSSDTTISGTTITIKNLENFKKYYFVVHAVDNVGNVDTNTVEVSAVPQMKATAVITQASTKFRNTGLIKIPFEVKRDVRDSVQLIILYSVNNNAQYDTARSVVGLTNGYIKNNRDTLTWNSNNDYKLETVDAKIRIVPIGYSGIGVSDSTSKFLLDNLAPRFVGIDSAKSASAYKVGSSILYWKAAKDTSKPITYYVYRSQQPINFAQQYVPADSTQATRDTLRDQQPNTDYYYYVRAKDMVGNVDTNIIFKTLRNPLVADYNDNGKIDATDLTTFSKAWRENNYNVADIGPTNGIPPNLIPSYDKQINFEDYFAFARMWNWSVTNTSANFLAKNQSTEETGIDSITSFVEEPVLKPKESKFFALRINQSKQVYTVGMTIHYNPEKISIDSLVLNFPDPKFILNYQDKEKGSVSFAVASLDKSFTEKLCTGDAIKILYTAKTKLVDESIYLETQIFDGEGNLLSKGMKKIEFNWRTKIPEEFALSQNYPNPFNPSTTIEYQLPKQSKVNLVIYNILGQEVIRLVDNQETQAGYYEVKWEGRNNLNQQVGSGVYFFRLFSKDFVQTKKMLLLR